MNTFTELSLSPALASNLAHYGFVTPTAVQSKAIPPALLGQDVVATAQTGTGKTLAFVLPLVEAIAKQPRQKTPVAIILSPTRELALQIQDTFIKLSKGTGIQSAAVVGGLNEQRQLQAIRKGAQVLIATPGRLIDFLDRKLVKLQAVRHVVLDEADRMLDMGFLPAMKTILAETPATRQTLFFSATIETSVAHLIRTYLKNPVEIAIGSTTKPCENVSLHVYEVEQDRKLGLLEKMLRQQDGTFLVFARTKHGADRLAHKLSRGGFQSTAIHGDRSQRQRNEALQGFQQGRFRILVATDVAARGIHVDGIAHVVNFDLPQVPEDFIHRVGRTGRAGAQGVATTFGTRSERSDIRRIERALNIRLMRQETGDDIPREEGKVFPITAAKPSAPFAKASFGGKVPYWKKRQRA